jgi:hypothetical protein
VGPIRRKSGWGSVYPSRGICNFFWNRLSSLAGALGASKSPTGIPLNQVDQLVWLFGAVAAVKRALRTAIAAWGKPQTLSRRLERDNHPPLWASRRPAPSSALAFRRIVWPRTPPRSAMLERWKPATAWRRSAGAPAIQPIRSREGSSFSTPRRASPRLHRLIEECANPLLRRRRNWRNC